MERQEALDQLDEIATSLRMTASFHEEDIPGTLRNQLSAMGDTIVNARDALLADDRDPDIEMLAETIVERAERKAAVYDYPSPFASAVADHIARSPHMPVLEVTGNPANRQRIVDIVSHVLDLYASEASGEEAWEKLNDQSEEAGA